jgi:UPF0176 protein
MTQATLPTQKQIAAFYHFQAVPQDQLESLAQKLEAHGRDLGLKGLVIFATEGTNGTVSGETREAVIKWLDFASETLGFPKFQPKWSESPEWPFRRFGIRLREEIVTLGKPEVQPLPPKSKTHLSPNEWDEVLENEDCVVLDTRNWYETRIGTFKKAIDPKLEEFSEFSEYVAKAELPKDKKILIFCTGGIRCEKAIVEMNAQGFEEVYQLDGGILNYLAEKPNKNFEGECFVFDNRVAVDQALQPTKQYMLCPHCGQPADQAVTCLRCDTDARICVSCMKDQAKNTCSKNCANHYRLSPGKKGRNQGANYRFTNAERGVRSQT